MSDAKEAFKKWVFEGNCPCCFPDWSYDGIEVTDRWEWTDEFNAWEVYAEINEENEDD